MNLTIKIMTTSVLTLLTQACFDSATEPLDSPLNEKRYKELMSAAPFEPADLTNLSVGCAVEPQAPADENYRSLESINYSKNGWENRLAKDWSYFSADANDGKILLIDIKKQTTQFAYRYLSNGTQDQLFEPWSSSKVMAISAAMAKARETGLQEVTDVGNVPLSDLITSIHSYSNFGQSTSSSNSIATYFINLVGREKISNYFSDGWLKLANQQVRIRGGYGEAPYKPEPDLWFGKNNPAGISIKGFELGENDPLAQSYRCDECGLTGNKPQTTLSMAEWLKRLAMHDREKTTNFPGLEQSDIEQLFYGVGHSQKNERVGGMMKGIGQNLAYAIAESISQSREFETKQVLDDATKGQWRIWQKIGWGPSETRGAAEYVLLAHVCLPHYKHGKEFTISAQVAIDGATAADEAKVDAKMQSLLSKSMREYFLEL